MNDFIGNIVEKGLTAASAIRPRPMSLFEPLPDGEFTGITHQPRVERDFQAHEFNAEGTVSRATVTIITKEPSSAHVGAHPIAVWGVQPDGSAAIDDARSITMQSQPDQAPFIGPNSPTSDTISPAFDVIQKHPEDQFPSGTHIANPARLPTTPRVISLRGKDAEPINQQTTIKGTETREPPSEHKLIKPIIKRVEADRPEASPSQEQPIGRLPSLMPIAGHNKEPMRPQPPGPTIQVTIGRIEVRATPPPPQNRIREKAPVPSMTLDEYLQRNNGGGR